MTATRRTAAVLWRVRLATGCLLLTAMAFWQAGGQTVPDTKLDLTLDPAAFLARSLHVWDPAGHLGQLQNQAYGYLFPMGPFHLLCRWAQVPEWVTQRLWWSLVLCTAFLGMWRLAGAVLGGSGWPRYLGALLFAVSPRMLGEVAVTSIEVWPMAVAPWVLLPLVDPRPRPTWRRIAPSAFAFGCIGGVNAVASGVALVLPTLWWLTRRPSRRTALGLLGWWGACLLAAAWWIGPLLVLGRYSPPFLDWIESASTTTQTASAFSALQGTTTWLAHLRIGDRPTWPAAWSMVVDPAMILVSTLPAVIGLVGLSLRGLRDATYWRLATVVGLALLTLGFGGPAGGPLAGELRALLDGPLAPLRNIHKFEPVIRIPLMIGFVHAVRCWDLVARRRARRSPWLPRTLVAGLAGVLVVAAAAPGVGAVLPRAGGYAQIADYWRDAARWLDARPGPGAVAVVPASPFADLTWGSPRDEPFQALLHRPFAVRDAVPLGNAGTTRLLDEVERELRTGTPLPGLRDTLRANGIRYLTVRNDLRAGARTAPPLAVHQALAQAGIERVASFGPPTGSAYETASTTLAEKTLLPYPSVEIFDAGPVDAARVIAVDRLRSMTGGPEDLPAVAGDLPAGASLVGSDADTIHPAGEVLTDGVQRREVIFGKASDNRSPVLTPDDDGTLARRVKDYVVDPSAGQTTVRWEGIAGVRASSSTADAASLWHPTSGTWPGAALDGDPATSWVSGDFGRSVGQWLEVTLAQPTDLDGAQIVFGSPQVGSALPTAVDVRTDAGTTTMPVLATQGDAGRTRYTLPLPDGQTRRLRITLRSVGPGASNGFAVAELALPGVHPVARLVLPAARTAAPDVISLRREETGRDGCLRQGTHPLCGLSLQEPREEAAGLMRELTTRAAASYSWSGLVRATSSPAAQALLDAPGTIHAVASTVRVPSLATRPGAVVDHDLATGWVAAAGDPRPSLTLTLPAVTTVRGLVLSSDPYLAASRPRQVQVRTDDGTIRDLTVGADGTLHLTARTRTLTLVFGRTDEVRTVDPASALVETLPVGVSEVQVLGADAARHPIDRTAALPGACGTGPSWALDGRTVATRVTGTLGDLLDDRPLRWEPCTDAAPLPLTAGRHDVDAPASGAYLPQSLLLRRVGAPVPAASTVSVRADGDDYEIGARRGDVVLALPGNANPGWRAVDGAGHDLRPVRLDGRRQGFVIPAGAATRVHAWYAPQTPFTAALLLGALGLALVALAALVRVRRPRSHDLRGAVVRGAAPFGPGMSPQVGAAIAALVLTLAFGVTGALAVGVAVGWWLLAARLPQWSAAVVVATAGAVAVVLVALQPWARGDGAALRSWPVQVLVVVAVATAAVRLTRGRAGLETAAPAHGGLLDEAVAEPRQRQDEHHGREPQHRRLARKGAVPDRALDEAEHDEVVGEDAVGHVAERPRRPAGEGPDGV